MRFARVLITTIVLLACGSSGSDDDGDGTEGGTSPTTSGVGTSSSGVDSSSSGVVEGSSGTTGETIQFCGLEDLEPGAPSPVVSGSGAMQIPPDIGDIIVRSCGCHLVDDFTVDAALPDYPDTGPVQFDTWEEWQGMYANTETPLLEVMRDRLAFDATFQMPLPACNVGGGESMLPEDRTTLLDWIDAGAPDGATWMP